MSPREVQVVELVVEGLTNKQIGARLSISRHTVHQHLWTIFAKLGAESRTQAAVKWWGMTEGAADGE